jgi:hypothetical protein
MLTFHDPKARWGRREFLRIGGLALGGWTLTDAAGSRAAAAAADLVRDRSVIFLFLHGGPSQIETFDPKLTAPAGVRSVTGETATSLSGVTFGSTFPRLAALANKLTVVRSFRTGDGNHDIKPVVSKTSLGANVGSLVARVVGTNDSRTGMPVNAALFPRAVDPTTQPHTEAFGRFTDAGKLGSAYGPFVPGAGGALQEDMRLSISRDRLGDRRRLLAELDRLKRRLETEIGQGLDRIEEQAFATILGGAAKAFDLADEDPRIIARYDTAPLVRPESISRKWNNYHNYVDNAKTLGKLLLLARRLCEAGCRFVTVTTNFVWDMHADVNNAGVSEGMEYMGRPLDHALSAFVEDCQSRGLTDKILLVATGEMGRTPKVNPNGGRDHWGGLAPLLLVGGGLPAGRVIGASTRDAGEPATEPVTIANLLATIAHALFDVGRLRIARGLPGDLVHALSDAAPIVG